MRVGRFWSIFFSDRSLTFAIGFLVKHGEWCVDDEDAGSTVATSGSRLWGIDYTLDQAAAESHGNA
jgi:hypothetical protein